MIVLTFQRWWIQVTDKRTDQKIQCGSYLQVRMTVEQEGGQEVPAGVGMRGGFPGRWNSKCKGPEAWGRGSEKPALAAIE